MKTETFVKLAKIAGTVIIVVHSQKMIRDIVVK